MRSPVRSVAPRFTGGQARRSFAVRVLPAGTVKSYCSICLPGGVNIEGLGPAIINLLMEEGLVRDPADLYRLTGADLIGLERFGKIGPQSPCRPGAE